MWKFTQRSWVGGRLDAELMGRQDLQKYFQGASEIKNFTIRRQGNLSKRRGTELTCDLKNLLGFANHNQSVGMCDSTRAVSLGEALNFTVETDTETGVVTWKHGTATVATYTPIAGSQAYIVADKTYFGIESENTFYIDAGAVSAANGRYVMDATTKDFVRILLDERNDDREKNFVTVSILEYRPIEIVKARIIHLLHDEDTGYYLFLTAGRIYILSKDGIRLRSGMFVQNISNFPATDYNTDTNQNVPYCIASGIGDNFIDDVKYAQSGDTIILVSHYFSPKKIVFDGELITKTDIDFSNRTWAKPLITSVESRSGSTWGSGASKTVYYACTYVKDGVESPMSDPFSFSYNLPWGNTCVVQITCARGNNAVEPDYYNIYKQESNGYGLIATSGATTTVDVMPSATSASATNSADFLSKPNFNSTQTGVSISSPTYSDVFQNFSSTVSGGAASAFIGTIHDSWLLSDATNSYTESYSETKTVYIRGTKTTQTTRYITYYNVPHGSTRFIGGINSGSAVTFDFGSASGTKVSDIEISPDAAAFFSGDNYYNVTNSSSGTSGGTIVKHLTSYPSQGMRFFSAGDTFNVVFNTKNAATGASHSFTKQVVCSMHSGCVVGQNIVVTQLPTGRTVNWGSNNVVNSNWSSVISASWKRSFKADAYSEITQYYGSAAWYTTSIVVSSTFNGVQCEMYWNGVKFANTSALQNVYEDDYISPDLTITPPKNSTFFENVTDFPACVGFYKQRLCFANTLANPFKFWMSCVGDLFNFNTHDSIQENDAISAELAALEFPEINHVIVGRDVLMLTGGGEWKVAPVSGNTLSYKTVSADVQSFLGSSKRLIPMTVGDEIVFADRNASRLYATKYNWSTDGYDSNDLSVLSQWLFKNNPMVDMSYSQYPDSTIDCVLQDGSVATLVYMKEHEVCAWARTEFGGGWLAKGVACAKTKVNGSSDELFLVERDGLYQVWSMKPDIPVRENSNGDAASYIHLDALHVLRSGETIEEGAIGVDVNGVTYVGYPFDAELVTIRPEPQGNETIQFEIKNAKDCEVRILNSGDFTIQPYGVGDEYAQSVVTGAKIDTNGLITLVSKDVKKLLTGNNSGDGRVQIKSRNWMPLDILSISTNYEIQPLSGSEG